MKRFQKKPKLRLEVDENAGNDKSLARSLDDVAVETHLRIMVEQMVREGQPVEAIEEAVRKAA